MTAIANLGTEALGTVHPLIVVCTCVLTPEYPRAGHGHTETTFAGAMVVHWSEGRNEEQMGGK